MHALAKRNLVYIIRIQCLFVYMHVSCTLCIASKPKLDSKLCESFTVRRCHIRVEWSPDKLHFDVFNWNCININETQCCAGKVTWQHPNVICRGAFCTIRRFPSFHPLREIDIDMINQLLRASSII
jgi:hypothetical protein